MQWLGTDSEAVAEERAAVLISEWKSKIRAAQGQTDVTDPMTWRRSLELAGEPEPSRPRSSEPREPSRRQKLARERGTDQFINLTPEQAAEQARAREQANLEWYLEDEHGGRDNP